MEQQLSFTCKARYFKSGEITSMTKEVWIVLHGYAQLAFYFIRKFESLHSRNIAIIAPEGLSHFYTTGANGRVGASWMTKENRLTDIENYIEYLNSIYQQEKLDNLNIPLTLLGFSQGAATACRWALSGDIHFKRLVLWAGIFPHDMDIEKGHEILSDKEVIAVYGTKDPYLNDDRLAEMKTISKKLKLEPRVISFDGAHTVDSTVFSRIIDH